MRKKRIKCREGDGFAVPLRIGGYCVGLVARTNNKGLVYGYFFAPRYLTVADIDVTMIVQTSIVYRGKFGDLGINEGQWPLIGSLPNWTPRDWLFPPLVRVDELTERAWLSHYDDKTFECLGET